VDGYHFDQEYQSALRASDVPLLVIDDGLHLDRHWNVDLLLNQNLGAETLPYACTPDTRCLLGTRYVLLRREFRHVAQRLHRGSGHACRVLVSLGGGDPDNQTLKVMKGIEETGRRDLEVKVVVGTANLHVDSLRAAMERSAVPTHILQDVKDMPDLMAWADVAVSAGGSTCWELAYMGVPNLIVVTADNQLRIARALHLAGVSENLGWFEGLTAGRISGALLSLLADAARMEAMIRQGQTMVDGQGPVRVVDAMVEAA
jgi:UDP-2,4-diacetamido-2,4,6-trideoxy-beta-L-altropyranose hydrolase